LGKLKVKDKLKLNYILI